jgi:hypothetical protein
MAYATARAIASGGIAIVSRLREFPSHLEP